MPSASAPGGEGRVAGAFDVQALGCRGPSMFFPDLGGQRRSDPDGDEVIPVVLVSVQGRRCGRADVIGVRDGGDVGVGPGGAGGPPREVSAGRTGSPSPSRDRRDAQGGGPVTTRSRSDMGLKSMPIWSVLTRKLAVGLTGWAVAPAVLNETSYSRPRYGGPGRPAGGQGVQGPVPRADVDGADLLARREPVMVIGCRSCQRGAIEADQGIRVRQGEQRSQEPSVLERLGKRAADPSRRRRNQAGSSGSLAPLVASPRMSVSLPP